MTVTVLSVEWSGVGAVGVRKARVCHIFVSYDNVDTTLNSNYNNNIPPYLYLH